MDTAPAKTLIVSVANGRKNFVFKNFTHCLLLLSLFQIPATSADSLPSAAIATAHPQATLAGHEILAAGGNAFDAAVAITASLGVVEPMSSGLGGGGFWLLHREKDQMQIMIDGREKAPMAAHRDMYLDKNGNVVKELSLTGPLAAGIPGIPAALIHIAEKYGNLPLSQSLAPAIKLAKQGFKVTKRYLRSAKFRLNALRASPAAAELFLDKGALPAQGSNIKQPDLAQTLQQIADAGRAGFYTGPVADKLVKGVIASNGIWHLKDLEDYQIVERAPIQGEYRGIHLTSASPPSSGGIALLTMLNILANYDLQNQTSGQQKHLIVEAMRRAYRDRAIYLGDPDFVDVPSFTLLHQYYAAGLSASIRTDKATSSSALPGLRKNAKAKHTTHFSIIDHQGNRVAATLTINYPFGSCFVPPGTGVLLNDEMDDFSAKPGSPNAYGLVGAEANAIAPGKRPLSSMSPTFLEDERGVAVLGTPGGSRIITMVLLATLDYAAGGDPKSMVNLPRYHHQYLPDVIQYEKAALNKSDKKILAKMGHRLKQISGRYGNMQVITWNRQKNTLSAASDPRGEGSAIIKNINIAPRATPLENKP